MVLCCTNVLSARCWITVMMYISLIKFYTQRFYLYSFIYHLSYNYVVQVVVAFEATKYLHPSLSTLHFPIVSIVLSHPGRHIGMLLSLCIYKLSPEFFSFQVSLFKLLMCSLACPCVCQVWLKIQLIYILNNSRGSLKVV